MIPPWPLIAGTVAGVALMVWLHGRPSKHDRSIRNIKSRHWE